MKIGSALLLVVIALMFAMLSLTVFEDLKGDAEYAVATVIALGIIVLGVAVILTRQFSRLRRFLPKLREQKPVAYFCVFELSGEVNLITSDKENITFWQVKNDQLTEFTSIKRDSVIFEKGDVQVALVRKVKGLILIDKNDPASRLAVNICRDHINPAMPALKGADLDEAIRRIKAGK